jgi:hypothetical protein
VNGGQFFAFMGFSSMVVRYFHVVGVMVFPLETNSPLLVNPDAVLAFSVSRHLMDLIMEE